MPRKIKAGIVVYKEKYDDENWYVAIEPATGAQAQGKTVQEAIEKIKEEIVKMSDAWCESEEREAVDAKLIEITLPE